MTNLLLAVIYLAFISLGLPDGLLGSAWPTMSGDLHAPLSWAGGISMTISAGTIISALLSDRLTLRFGAGRVTAFSVALTAAALMGFSFAPNYWALIVCAIPYGLGAGGVDAALNNYMAIHYTSRHMSWLHCMWGVGASIGPYIMGYALSGGQGWNMGYRYIAILQIVLTAALIFSLPLWKKQGTDDTGQTDGEMKTKPLSLRQIIKIPGAKEILITFFCYCALEQTTGLWASSYLVLRHGLPAETAAGIALTGLILIGLGCAPVYPSIIHSTPEHFGADKSQAMIGVQMAFAYVGTCLMPPVFGFIANHISVSLFPGFLLVILALMTGMYEKMLPKVSVNTDE